MSDIIKNIIQFSKGEVDLSERGLFDEDMDRVAEWIKCNPNVLSINLYRNNITECGIIKLLSLDNISYLTVRYNDISESKELIEALLNTNIKEICFYDNPINKVGTKRNNYATFYK
ncbi:Leucine-rich repeat-containing protein [Orpheovirus IHUMI-LCC2]|uniref:Leucine-rich repeat-containing protein n=1 Tax=Orpheovirus IHUMI-LCC2 TaxID=2023057 RepID=A0A2I2L662_9VIRU|nr:Leucine-rich repeat-containing protein [Orpheovirus IHUMI-LCC2]SNW63017.1 Leucine-rich repeat-containing protein [Orpheovirus IHUMI-LCC2]